MRKPCTFLFKLFGTVMLSSVAVCLCLSTAVAGHAVVEKIQVLEDPFAVKLFISGAVPVKVIQVEKKELVIAVKSATLAKGFRIVGKKHPGIRDIAVEHLPGEVLAVIVTGDYPYRQVDSGFNSSDSSFMVTFASLKKTAPVIKPEVTSPKASDTQKTSKTEASVKAPEQPPEPETPVTEPEVPVQQPAGREGKEKQVSQITSAPIAEDPKPDKKVASAKQPKSKAIPEAPVYKAPLREPSKFKGDISDLVQVIKDEKCDTPQLEDALVLIQKGLFKESFDILDQYLLQENFTCLEAAYFLRAYVFYKQVPENEYASLMKAEKFFQDALIAYPVSPYVPYGYAAIGMIQKQLHNISAAEGYFNIIKDGYLAYSGMPEVLYHLADVYDQKGYLDKSLRYYKQVFEDDVLNAYIPSAGIGYGKALFKKKEYLNSLSILNYIVQAYPKKVYESHELLLSIGNANYEVGLSKNARNALTRVLNLFPDIPEPDVILSRIGDTYGMENNEEKAIKIYELVRQKYPGTQGYVASSIGIARYLKSDEEKIEIYTMIKKEFPENTYSRIAMMRLAEIYQANKEYDKCIKEIEDLLSTHPRGLRYEAVKLMQRAYEAMFKQQLKSDEYTKVLNRYEQDHTKIDRMSSKDISFSVGTAYLEAKLYEEAFNHLLTAYKRYKRSERSPQLLFGLGVAMDETGRDNDALKLFNSFSRQYPKNSNFVESLLRSGNIYFEKNDFKKASDKFSDAFKSSKKSIDKGRILMEHAVVYEKKGDLKTASDFQEAAVKQIVLAKGDNLNILTKAYKDLGRLYMERTLYADAADAYLNALNLSNDEEEKANLGFLLGDAYQKGNILLKAKEAYKQVADLYDSVWARLAQQRLDTLALAAGVQSS